MFIDFFFRPYSLIKGPTFIKVWNFSQGLQIFSSLMGFFWHKFGHFVHVLRLFKALRLFFLTNFPGPTVIPCPTSILDSRVVWMISYEFKWVKSTVVAPFWGPSNLEISIYSGLVTSQRETTILCTSYCVLKMTVFKKFFWAFMRHKTR